jgi:hypothetical protein
VAASFFDVDGTLVRTNLLHPTVFYLANQTNPVRSLGALARAAMGVPRMVVAEAFDRRRFNELLFATYEGISEDRLLLLADEAFDRVVRGAVYPGARDLVKRCADASARPPTSPTGSRSRTGTRRGSSSGPSWRGRRKRGSFANGRKPAVTILPIASRTPTAIPTCRCSRSSDILAS